MLLLLLATALASDGSVPVGTTVLVQHETELELELRGTGLMGAFVRPLHRRQEQHFAVRPTDEGFVVGWTHNRHQVLEPGYAHDQVLPVVGQSYVVTDEVVAADGHTPTAAEKDIVGQMHLLSMLQALRGMWSDTLPVGEAVPVGPMFVGMMADAPGTARLVEGWLTVQARDPQTTTLGLTLHLEAEGDDVRGATVQTTLRATGRVVVDTPTGWTRRFEVDGTVTVEAKGKGIRSSGTGPYRNHVLLDYR